MKILLVAINAKYIHSNLAVYCLKSYAAKRGIETELAEYTINYRQDDILSDIYQRKPDVIAFSCYIIEETGEVILETPEMKNAAARKTCTHTYKSVTYGRHDKNSKGGCTVKQYQCQRCTKCGNKKNVTLQSSTNYVKCPH